MPRLVRNYPHPVFARSRLIARFLSFRRDATRSGATHQTREMTFRLDLWDKFMNYDRPVPDISGRLPSGYHRYPDNIGRRNSGPPLHRSGLIAADIDDSICLECTKNNASHDRPNCRRVKQEVTRGMSRYNEEGGRIAGPDNLIVRT